MKNLSLALASVGLVGVGFASAIVIYNQFETSEVTAQQTSIAQTSEPQLLAQNTAQQVSQSDTPSTTPIPNTISIDSEMAYSLATFCHSYTYLDMFDGDYGYIRKSDNEFAPREVEISLKGTCQSFIRNFENQVPEQVHYDVIYKLN